MLQERYSAGQHGQTQGEVHCSANETLQWTAGGAAGEGGERLLPAVLGRDGLHQRRLHQSHVQVEADLTVLLRFTVLNRRDSRLGSIAGGADEIMLGIICKTMGILPRPQKKK